VSGTRVTAKNKDDVKQDVYYHTSDVPTVSYAPDDKILTLNNAALTFDNIYNGQFISDELFTIYSDVEGLTVKLIGDNKFTETNNNDKVYGIYSDRDLTVSGDGSLDIQITNNNYATGIYAGGPLTLGAKEITVDISGRGVQTGLYTENALKIDGCKLNVIETGTLGEGHIGAYFEKDSVIGNSEVEFTINGAGTDVYGFYSKNDTKLGVGDDVSMLIDTAGGEVLNKRIKMVTNRTAHVEDADGNKTTINPSNKDLSIYHYLRIHQDMKTYSLVSGDKQEWKKGTEAGPSFAYQATIWDEDTLNRLETVKIDGKDVAAEDYSTAAGTANKGVVITLNPAALENLEAGKHKLNVKFTDFSEEVPAEFTIVDKDPTPVETIDMYRMYNPNSGEHFYTSSKEEIKTLEDAGWVEEGIGFKALAKSAYPMYRLYNPVAGDHHYTGSMEERDSLIRAGWIAEGIAWYSSDDSGVPQFRLYNPNAKSGAHHYTASKEEKENLIKAGWKDEGIGFYTE
jgi:hypothetical protein